MTPEEFEDALVAASEGRIVTDLGATDALLDALDAIGAYGMTPAREAAARRAFTQAADNDVDTSPVEGGS